MVKTLRIYLSLCVKIFYYNKAFDEVDIKFKVHVLNRNVLSGR